MAKKPKKGELAATITIALGLAGTLRDTSMANILNTPYVLDLDTAAVISATNKFKVRQIALVPAAAAATAVLKDGAGREIARLSAGAGLPADVRIFGSDSTVFTGLELASITGANARLQIYCR